MLFNTFGPPIFHRSDAQLREIRETMFMQMAPALCTQITAQLSQVLLTEIQKSLYPIVSTKLDAMKAQVQNEIAQKMTVTDRIVKENIANMCRSKVMSIFGSMRSMQGLTILLVGYLCRKQWTHLVMLSPMLFAMECITSMLIRWKPSFCRHMRKPTPNCSSNCTIHSTKEQLLVSVKFATPSCDARSPPIAQTLSTLIRARKDTNQLAGYTKTYEPIHAELVKLMRTIPDQMRNMNDMIVNSCSQRVTNEVNKDLKSMQSNLLKNLKENLKLEVGATAYAINIRSDPPLLDLERFAFVPLSQNNLTLKLCQKSNPKCSASTIAADQKRFRSPSGQPRGLGHDGRPIHSPNASAESIRRSRTNPPAHHPESNQQGLPPGAAGQRSAAGRIRAGTGRLLASVQPMSAGADRATVARPTDLRRYVQSQRAETKVSVRRHHQFEYARSHHQRACTEGADRIGPQLSLVCRPEPAKSVVQRCANAHNGRARCKRGCNLIRSEAAVIRQIVEEISDQRFAWPTRLGARWHWHHFHFEFRSSF